jgi:prevent-host-death family protein
MGKHWTVAEAKAKLSEVIERAKQDGPQTITRHGRSAAVVVSAEEWQRRSGKKQSFAEFLMSSPLRGSKLKIERIKEQAKAIDL